MEGIIRAGGGNKYQFGNTVLINGNIAAVVLYGYNMYMDGFAPMYFYRLIVDTRDLSYRCINNNVDQAGDISLLAEDFNSLITDTNNISVVEIEEDKLTLFEYPTAIR